MPTEERADALRNRSRIRQLFSFRFHAVLKIHFNFAFSCHKILDMRGRSVLY